MDIYFLPNWTKDCLGEVIADNQSITPDNVSLRLTFLRNTRNS